MCLLSWRFWCTQQTFLMSLPRSWFHLRCSDVLVALQSIVHLHCEVQRIGIRTFELCLRMPGANGWTLAPHAKLPRGKKIMLIILDGWGEQIGDEFNAIHVAKTPIMDYLKTVIVSSFTPGSGSVCVRGPENFDYSAPPLRAPITRLLFPSNVCT